MESKEIANHSTESYNDPLSKNFVRYLNAKTLNDGAMVYADGHLGTVIEVNSTREFVFRSNVNFYGIKTNSESSAVHIPTPVYNRSK